MTRSELAVLLALTAVPLQAKPRAPRPGATELMLKALAGPATGYTAVERVQVFVPGHKPKAMTVAISALPGGKVRRELAAGRRKTAGPVEIRSGDEPAQRGLARLLSLYELSVSTGGVVAKRKTWKVELRLKNGILRRALWVDRDSGLLLKRETYRDDGSLARRERIVKLALPAAVEAALFTGAVPRKPWAPDGFILADGSGASRAYTNGLESYTIKDGRVSGDLAEDDAARVLESAGR